MRSSNEFYITFMRFINSWQKVEIEGWLDTYHSFTFLLHPSHICHIHTPEANCRSLYTLYLSGSWDESLMSSCSYRIQYTFSYIIMCTLMYATTVCIIIILHIILWNDYTLCCMLTWLSFYAVSKIYVRMYVRTSIATPASREGRMSRRLGEQWASGWCGYPLCICTWSAHCCRPCPQAPQQLLLGWVFL